MLRRLCADKVIDWDRYVTAFLFACSEVPHKSLGFSPFELLYGMSVQGPIMRELFTKDTVDPETKLM